MLLKVSWNLWLNGDLLLLFGACCYTLGAACFPLAGASLPTALMSGLEAGNYSYLANLDPASWHEALTLCPMYGNGFFLANFNDQDELDDIKPWLASLPQGNASKAMQYLN